MVVALLEGVTGESEVCTLLEDCGIPKVVATEVGRVVMKDGWNGIRLAVGLPLLRGGPTELMTVGFGVEGITVAMVSDEAVGDEGIVGAIVLEMRAEVVVAEL